LPRVCPDLRNVIPAKNRDSPFNLINGAPARFYSVLEALLYNSSPTKPKFHLIVNNFPAGWASHAAKNTRTAIYLCKKPTFSCDFGIPPLLASIPEPGFQQFHTSSRPGGYGQKRQLPDTNCLDELENSKSRSINPWPLQFRLQFPYRMPKRSYPLSFLRFSSPCSLSRANSSSGIS